MARDYGRQACTDVICLFRRLSEISLVGHYAYLLRGMGLRPHVYFSRAKCLCYFYLDELARQSIDSRGVVTLTWCIVAIAL